MFSALLLPIVMVCLPPACLEPDGSRTLGIVPPYHAAPEPPSWLRAASHALAVGCGRATRHYVYEAYADGDGWLVRYLHFPGADEAGAEAQQAFLFGADPVAEARRLEPDEIRFGSRKARWQGRAFVLVDRRDLMAPATRPPFLRRR